MQFYPKKAPAVENLKKQHSEGKPVRLWGRDVSEISGAKNFYVCPLDEVYNIIHSGMNVPSSAQKKGSLPSEYEWLEDDVCFGIDFDADTTLDEKFVEGYDCSPDILSIIDNIDAFNNAELGKMTTRKNWIVLKSGYNKKKKRHSYHMILVGIKFVDVDALKEYALAILRDQEIVGLDISLYSKRCLRLMGCVKKGESEERMLKHEPLPRTRGPSDYSSHYDFWKDTLISYTEGYEDVRIPDRWTAMSSTKKVLKHRDPQVVDAAIHVRLKYGEHPEARTLQGLLDCLATSRANDYLSWRDVGFALRCAGNTNSMFTLFDEFSRQSSKYDSHRVRQQWNESQDNTRSDPITVGTLFHLAKEDNYQEYMWVIRTCHVPTILLKDSMPDWNTFARASTSSEDMFVYDEYDERFCRPINLSRTSGGQLLVSNCGTGKSNAVIDLIKDNPEARILKILPRISCTEDDLKRMQDSGIDEWKAYLQNRKECETSHHQQFTTSPESIWKIQKNQTYDFVILDEPEAILDQLDSFKTMQGKLPECAEALVKILLYAGKIILSDALPSNRLLRFIETTFKGSGKQFLIERNTHEHLNRKAIHLVPDRPLSEQNVHAYHDQIIKMILSDIQAGLRVVVFAATKKFGDRLHAAVQAAKLDNPANYSYHSSDNINKINKDLKNLAEAWSCKLLVVYTPVLTVGSSCDRPNFDRSYAVLSNKSVNVRNSVQACQRVRQFREDLMIFFIDDVVQKVCYVTEETQSSHIEWRRNSLNSEFDDVMRKHRSVSCERIFELQQTAESPEDFQGMMMQEAERLQASPILRTPAVIHQNRVLTALESDVAYAHFTGLFYALAYQVGYKQISRQTLVLPEQAVVVKQDAQLPLFTFEQLPLISDHKASVIESDICAATDEDQWSLKKYKFCKHIIGTKSVSFEAQALLFNKYTVDKRSAQWLFAAYQMDNKTVLRALRHDIARLPYAEYTAANGVIQARCEDIFKLLGLRHGHDIETVLSRERLERVTGDILPLIKTLRQLLNKESKPSRAKKSCNVSQTGVHQIVASLNVVLITWCGTELLNSAKNERKTLAGKQSRLVRYQLQFVDDFSKALYTCGVISQ